MIFNFIKRKEINSFLLISFVIFGNLAITGILSLADIFYTGVLVIGLFILFSQDKILDSRFIYPLIFLSISYFDYILFGHTRGMASAMRFCFGFVVMTTLWIYYSKVPSKAISFLNAFCDFCVLASLFIIIQVIFYYVFRINLKFSFGEYERLINSASEYNPLFSSYYRTGGFFREPSFFGAFVFPALEYTYSTKQIKKFIVILLGILFSTSTLGYGLVLIWISYYSFKKKISLGLIFSVGTFILITVLMFPDLFLRLGEVKESGGSFGGRILEPFTIIYSENTLSLLGVDPTIHYDFNGNARFFANTFVFLYLYFGVIGLLVFVRFICLRNHLVLTLMTLAVIMSEGLYGRMEFWIMLLSCSLYSEYSREFVIYNKS